MPPARLVSRKEVFKRFFSLDVIQAAPRSLRSDAYLPVLEREVLRIGEVVAVLPYIPETDEVVLNQQFRMGAFIAGKDDPFIFEIAAGLIDAGETPGDAARREVYEETGCRVLDLEPALRVYSSPGSTDELFHIYIARIDRARAGDYGVPEEAEEIRTHVLPAATVIDMADSGRILQGTAVAAINWFARNRDRLRKQWRNT